MKHCQGLKAFQNKFEVDLVNFLEGVEHVACKELYNYNYILSSWCLQGVTLIKHVKFGPDMTIQQTTSWFVAIVEIWHLATVTRFDEKSSF